jgi:haloacetate dehalogenase
MFEGFERRTIETREVAIHARVGGAGPPLLLLHGYPQTHVMWRKLAPELARRFTVVAPDLRGYGDSGTPPADAEHRAYSKRAMGEDMAELMGRLGFERFAVAGHDRGARVAYRMALDHPARIQRLVTLDIVPTAEMWRSVDKDFATATFHWFFLIQPDDLPERLIGADPDYFLDWKLDHWAGDPKAIEPEARAEYKRCFRRPEVIHASCEDYRAGATVDQRLDEADLKAGRRIACPMLALWARRGFADRLHDPLAVWRRWADDVRGAAIDCGHFLPEEAPEAVLGHLRPFLGA